MAGTPTTTTESMADEGVPFVFKRKSGGSRAALRKRPLSDDESAEASTSALNGGGDSEVVHASKRRVVNPLIQGTSGARRRAKELDAAADGLELSDEEDKQETLVRHSAATRRERRRSSSPPAETSTAAIEAGVALKGKHAASLAKGKGQQQEGDAEDDGLYKGAAAAKHQVEKQFGPMKGGPSNVRTITLVDYQPDVCQDYKETGFCGFGDSCKFLHDRGDYLHGWQLDNSFLSNSAASGSFLAKQAARERGQSPDSSDSEGGGEQLPFACLICRKPFGKEPVVTLCGHYFDASCAVKRFAKTAKCFACGKPTNGVFNKAKKLIEAMKEREKIQAAQAAAEGDGTDSEGEGLEIEGLAEEEPAGAAAGAGAGGEESD